MGAKDRAQCTVRDFIRQFRLASTKINWQIEQAELCGEPRSSGVVLPETASKVSLQDMANLELVALVVRDYEPAIRFFVDILKFDLIEDTPSQTNDGRPKRWVVVRPAGAQTGILLARADGERQTAAIGQQFAGRVGLFLRVEDFDPAYERMVIAGVRFISEPRIEAYGKIAVFLDLEGNRWDLLGPDPSNER